MVILKLVVLTALLLSNGGCASISNVTKYGDEYYRNILAKSKNTQDLKDYLKQNNIKLGLLIYKSNLPAGELGAVMLDGQILNFTSKAYNDWLGGVMNTLPTIELSGLEKKVAGYTLTYCGDFTHANIEQDAESGSMEYTYFLSQMTMNDRQFFLKSQMLSNCEIKEILGKVFYMKEIHVSSNIRIAKVSTALKDKSQPLKPIDNLSLILKDMADQAMTAMLTDGEMLQAFKALKLTDDKSVQPSKPVDEIKQSVNIPERKITQEMGELE